MTLSVNSAASAKTSSPRKNKQFQMGKPNRLPHFCGLLRLVNGQKGGYCRPPPCFNRPKVDIGIIDSQLFTIQLFIFIPSLLLFLPPRLPININRIQKTQPDYSRKGISVMVGSKYLSELGCWRDKRTGSRKWLPVPYTISFRRLLPDHHRGGKSRILYTCSFLRSGDPLKQSSPTSENTVNH